MSKEISDHNIADSHLKAEEAFWVMRYFMVGHYQSGGREIDLSDILNASQPFESDENGHFDGKFKGNRQVAPADTGMFWHWNEAVRKYR